MVNWVAKRSNGDYGDYTVVSGYSPYQKPIKFLSKRQVFTFIKEKNCTLPDVSQNCKNEFKSKNLLFK